MKLLRIFLIVLVFQVVTGYSAEEELPVFTDVTKEAGIDFKHSYGDFELDNIDWNEFWSYCKSEQNDALFGRVRVS